MFRCPACAKIWKLPLTNNYWLLANTDMNKWHIVKEPITLTSRFIRVNNLHELAEKLDEMNLQLKTEKMEEVRIKERPGIFTTSNESEDVLECPSCHEKHRFIEWNDAWDYPMDYFEADNLCSCGGELWFDKVIGTNRYAMICEECGWEKPRSYVSGGE